MPVAFALALMTLRRRRAMAQSHGANETPQQNVRQSEQYQQLLCTNPAFRAKRIAQECGPLQGSDFYDGCVASFDCEKQPTGANWRKAPPVRDHPERRPDKGERTMANPAPGWVKKPEHRVDLHPESRRVRVSYAGAVVADSTAALRCEETGHGPVMYIPANDMRLDLMKKTEHSTYCPFKGTASYWTIEAGGKTAENAIWGYETPYDEMTGLADYYAFYGNRVDSVEIT